MCDFIAHARTARSEKPMLSPDSVGNSCTKADGSEHFYCLTSFSSVHLLLSTIMAASQSPFGPKIRLANAK